MVLSNRDNALPYQGLTVVFDLDGTIADTAPDLVDAANFALQSNGYDLAPADAIKAGVGYGTKAMLQTALTSLNRQVNEHELARLSDCLIAYYNNHIYDKTTLFPGFRSAATELKEKGARLALCTNKRQALMSKLLTALNIRSLFDAVAAGDSFAYQKPDPRHITDVVQMAGGVADRAIMVGDSEADIGAAKAAGILSIAVSFGYASRPVQDLGANQIINSFDDLLIAIEKLMRVR